MNKININSDLLDSDMAKLKNDQSKSTLDNIKRDLNKIFKDSECKEVLFTKNTDKMFFGMSTYAILNNSDTRKIITDDQPIRIKCYFIEIDSKILEIGLTSRELSAILLHEVGHLVNDSSPVLEVRKSLDKYMAEIGDEIKLSSLESNQIDFFKFALQDSLRRITSITSRNDQEILADEFVFMCGYGPELQSAFKKIKSNIPYMGIEKSLLGLIYRYYIDDVSQSDKIDIEAVSSSDKAKIRIDGNEDLGFGINEITITVDFPARVAQESNASLYLLQKGAGYISLSVFTQIG